MRFDPNYLSLLSRAIGTSSAAEQKLTNELSSGLRVSKLSDDPVAASSNVLLAGSISGIDSFVKSSSSEQSLLQVTDSALGDVVSQVTQAITLATSAGTGTLNASNLQAIAKQVVDIRDSVVAAGNTSYLGSYIFGGSAGASKPFVLDESTSPATVSYSGDSVVRTITTPEGQQVGVNVPGDQVFTNGSGNLLATLNKLVTDISSGDTSAVEGDSSNLTAALGVVSTQRSTIGSSLSRLTSESTYASSQETLFEAQQSSLLSADTAQVATSLSTAEVQHQALLGVVSTVGKENLFDYLK